MKHVMVRMFKLIVGKSAPIDVGARRYLDAAAFGTDLSGEFFASAPKKVTGPIETMCHEHLHDRANQDAAWNAVVKIVGIGYPVSSQSS